MYYVRRLLHRRIYVFTWQHQFWYKTFLTLQIDVTINYNRKTLITLNYDISRKYYSFGFVAKTNKIEVENVRDIPHLMRPHKRYCYIDIN